MIERHGGTVEKFIGDAVMAVFGIPTLHEDDALRAVRAATEMRDGLAALNDELKRTYEVEIRVRTGVNTGEVVAGEGQTLATGDTVNVAARLEQAAAPGEILLGETTFALVRDAVRTERLEPLALKGKSAGVPAHRLLEVRPDRLGHARRLDSPLVGREREQELLRQAFARAIDDRACHLFTVLGAAGVGKSRLVEEFVAAVDPTATVLRGRCLSYGEGITFWPLAEAVRAAAGLAARRDRRAGDGGARGAGRRRGRGRARRAPARPARRPHRGVRRAGGELLGGPAPARGARAPAAARRRLRRHPLGRADVPRPDRARRRLVSRRADPADLPGAPRAPRPTARLGRRQAQRDLRPARAARRPRPAVT